MRIRTGTALTVAIAASWALAQQGPLFDPHGDALHGVLRVVTDPPTRGGCNQCHPLHGEGASLAQARLLFAANDNNLCFATDGASPCHSARPDNYPLGESDRLPATDKDAGYFEANTGGRRRPGVELRGRWPGALAYGDPRLVKSGRWVSPHAHDPDMPRRDARGEGACLACHDPHAGAQRDLLRADYGGIGGHETNGPPARYRLCFSCHGADGPAGMEPSGRWIEDYYDSGLNGVHAGHQIRRDGRIALSWPAHVRAGDKLPCYDCHGVHGSRGHDGVRPNAFLISDQRPGWSDLYDTRGDAAQARRFCLGCHIASDGIPGSQTVQDIVMNAIPAAEPAHLSSDPRSCYDCHGSDYSGPTAHNVHNPSAGDPFGSGLEEAWGP